MALIAIAGAIFTRVDLETTVTRPLQSNPVEPCQGRHVCLGHSTFSIGKCKDEDRVFR